MTINRYDEDTIECILSLEDLKNRNVSSLDALSYSSPVLKSLTHDLLRYLQKKYDFDMPEGEPASIDVIPHNDGSLSVIFHRNGNDDELDPRYSMFTDAPEPDSDDSAPAPVSMHDALHQMISSIIGSGQGLTRYLLSKDSDDHESASKQGVVVFDSFSDVLHLVSLLTESIPMSAGIFRSERGAYLMIFHFYKMDDRQAEALLSIICEYGMIRQMFAGTQAYVTEHCDMIMPVVPFIILKTLVVNYK